jgi:hypothetical protein
VLQSRMHFLKKTSSFTAPHRKQTCQKGVSGLFMSSVEGFLLLNSYLFRLVPEKCCDSLSDPVPHPPHRAPPAADGRPAALGVEADLFVNVAQDGGRSRRHRRQKLYSRKSLKLLVVCPVDRRGDGGVLAQVEPGREFAKFERLGITSINSKFLL